MAHKGHAANKKETLQTKKKRCKQKRNAANKKETLQAKRGRCKQKANAANKKRILQITETLQIKCTLQIKNNPSCARTRPKGLGKFVSRLSRA